MSPGVLMKTKTVTVMILLLPLYMFKCSSALGMLLSARGQAWSWRGCVSAEQNSLVEFIYVSSLKVWEGHRQKQSTLSRFFSSTGVSRAEVQSEAGGARHTAGQQWVQRESPTLDPNKSRFCF